MPANPQEPPGFPAEIPSPATLAALHEVMVRCTRCDLFLSRTQVVPGAGNPRASEIGPGQTSAAQVGPGEIRALQIGAGKVGVPQQRMVQLDPLEDLPRKIAS